MIGRRLAEWASKLYRVPSASASGWLAAVAEPLAGEWQTEARPDPPEALTRSSAVFCCVTGIASDIAKLRIKLSRDVDGIWTEVAASPYLPVLRKPNRYQNRMQFLEQWALSKLLTGNAYILLERDNRGGEAGGVVRAMYPLDPRLTFPLVSDGGAVYYQTGRDPLSAAGDAATFPASEVIHDRANCLWHPLVGVSPLHACAMSGSLANRIQSSSVRFFRNRALPGGLLTAPGRISDEAAERLKEAFQERFSGDGAGRLAVVGDGLKFEPMQMTAEASQLVEQMKMSVDDVARAFHYPHFKLGGQLPTTAGNVEATIMTYYTDCLQQYVEAIETCLDEGLGLSGGLHAELDLDGLMRMDTASMFAANNQAVGGGWMKPNEARHKANLPPVAGGDTPYLQQQNYSLAALGRRDGGNPFPDAGAPAAPSESAGDSSAAISAMFAALASESKEAGHGFVR